MRFFSTFLSTLLIPLVAVMPLRAELAVSTTAATATPSAGITSGAATTPDQANLLKVRLADESKATVEANSIVKGYAILVTDASGLPVADAAVAIRFPDEGATGFFVNGEHSAVAYTNASGVAKFPQVNWGSATGGIAIRVTAVKGDLHAGALIEQTIVASQIGRSAASASVAPIPSAQDVAPAPDQTAVQPPMAKAKTPGVPTSVAAIHSGATPDQAPAGADPVPASDSVSVVNTSGSKGGSANTKKWVVLAAVLGAAGVGAALALAGKGGGATSNNNTPSTATTIGTPTISVGH